MHKLLKYYLGIFILLGLKTISVSAQDLIAPEIDYITVSTKSSNPGAVQLRWHDNNTLPVEGYYVFKLRMDGVWESIKDKSSASDSALLVIKKEYLDLEASADKYSVTYRVQAISRSITGDQPLSEPFSTIYMGKIDYDSCSMTNTLTWNRQTDRNENISYKVLDGETDITGSDLETNIDTVFVHKVSEAKEYSYRIQVVKSSGTSANSNTRKVYANAIKEPSQLAISNILYDATTVNLTALVDNTADLLGHVLMISDDNDTFEVGESLMFDETATEIEFTHASNKQSLYYKVKAVNICSDSVLDSEVIQPILLEYESDETQVQLNWNESFIESSFSENYFIKVNVDEVQKPDIIPAGNFQQVLYSDYDQDNGAENFCFTIEATESNGYKSVSNTVCATRQIICEFPTAFTPNGDGKNDIFGKPFSKYIKNAKIADFNIIIYDKYGGRVYETNNPSYGWTGASSRISLKNVPEGGYVYFLEFTTEQNKHYEKSGSISVVYP